MTDIKKTIAKKTKGKQNSKHTISIDKKLAYKWFQIICFELPVLVLLIYIFVQILFFKTFKCNASENIRYCQCVRLSMSEEMSFLGKIKFIILNPSAEELENYVPFKRSAECRIKNFFDNN